MSKFLIDANALQQATMKDLVQSIVDVFVQRGTSHAEAVTVLGAMYADAVRQAKMGKEQAHTALDALWQYLLDSDVSLS